MKLRSLRAMQSRAFRNPLAWAALAFPLVAVIDNKLIPVAMGIVLIAAGVAAWPRTLRKLRAWPPLVAGLGLLLRVGADQLLRAVREGVMLWGSERGTAGRSQGLRLQVASSGTASVLATARCHNVSIVIE